MVQYQCPFCGFRFALPQPVSSVHCPACGKDFASASGAQNQAFEQPQQSQQPPPPPFGQQQPPFDSQQSKFGSQQQFGSQQSQFGPQSQYAYGSMPPEPGVFDEGPSGKSRGVAGLLAILLGGFGVHYIYLGKVGGAIICFLLTVITCGLWSILALIQGVVMLTMKQDEFERKFVYSQSSFPVF